VQPDKTSDINITALFFRMANARCKDKQPGRIIFEYQLRSKYGGVSFHKIAMQYKPDFRGFLPSPFGRGAGGEGMAMLHKLGRQLFLHKSPCPNPLPEGDETNV
jgi:hypothetical protein